MAIANVRLFGVIDFISKLGKLLLTKIVNISIREVLITGTARKIIA